MIITIGNVKGGVGKSTIALNLAITRAKYNNNILLIDADKQQTSALAIAIRKNQKLSPDFDCISLLDGNDLLDKASNIKSKYNDVIIDVGGKDNPTLRASLLISDVVLIPVAPRSFDIWALNEVNNLVKEVRGLRNNSFKIYAFLNNADINGKDNLQAKDIIKDYECIEYLDAPITRRKAFASVGEGIAINEYKPQDKKAINEFDKLYNLIYI